MNPWPVILADLRQLKWVAWLCPLLIAIAIAVGVAISAQEAALRSASAKAADDFDLLIGAPGSQSQLVLTSVYLQPEALTLLDGKLLNDLAADPRVRGAAPIAFGDIVRGYPVVGTTANFVTRWGRLAPNEGRVFAAEGEAVVGAGVALAVGAKITPSHAMAGRTPPFGIETPEGASHKHDGVVYTVVGRLPALGTPWNRAILVPVETVWETHGLGNGHARDNAPLGPPFDAQTIPGVPAIAVKARGIADAYTLRSQYRRGGTMAFFPAEVLVSLYRTLGDIRDVLVIASILNDVLIFAATTMLLVALSGLRQRRYAVLRALGASRGYILIAVWSGAAILLAAGCVAGLALASGATALLGTLIARETGLVLPLAIELKNFGLVAGLIGLGSVFALVPALLTFRKPVAETLRA